MIKTIPLALVVALASMAQTKPDPEKGNEIFDEQCAQCHSAYSAEKKSGPSLQFLFARTKLDVSGKPVTDANIVDRIEKGGKGMPPFKNTLGPQDKADLLAYLRTL